MWRQLHQQLVVVAVGGGGCMITRSIVLVAVLMCAHQYDSHVGVGSPVFKGLKQSFRFAQDLVEVAEVVVEVPLA